jgi:hypothetical protein
MVCTDPSVGNVGMRAELLFPGCGNFETERRNEKELIGAPDQPRERNLHLGLIAAPTPQAQWERSSARTKLRRTSRHMFRRYPRLARTDHRRPRKTRERSGATRLSSPKSSPHQRQPPLSPIRRFAQSPVRSSLWLHPSPLLDLDLILHFCRRAKSLEEAEVAGAGCGYLE